MVSQFPLFIPGHDVSCLYQVIRGFLAYTRSSEDFLLIPGHLRISCLYQVIRGFLAYTRCSVLFTPVAGVWWALFWAGITLKSDSWAVCVSGAWVSAIHAWRWFWGANSFQPSSFRNVHDHGRPLRSANCSSFRRGSVQFNPRIRTSSARMGQYKAWP